MPKLPLKARDVKLPNHDSTGSFWENRKDRRHCGIDLYASPGSEVVAIETAQVTAVGLMTSPDMLDYWNRTFQIVVKNQDGTYWKYGEMAQSFVSRGDKIIEGQVIGTVGCVLNVEKIDHTSPKYIQHLKDTNPSMLHLELYLDNPIIEHKNYLGGNWFGEKRPPQLLNPLDRLKKS